MAYFNNDLSKLYIEWRDIEEFLQKMEHEHELEEFTGVYGIPRGGVCLAVMLSHRLNIPYFGAPFPGCLIVDDICDSGESLAHYIIDSSKTCKNYRTATLVCNTNNKLGIKPTYYLQEHTQGCWVVFPWEECTLRKSTTEVRND